MAGAGGGSAAVAPVAAAWASTSATVGPTRASGAGAIAGSGRVAAGRSSSAAHSPSDIASAAAVAAGISGLAVFVNGYGVRAVSDATRTVASPLSLIRKTKFTDDANALFKLMESRGASAIVIGLPVNMDGTEGPRCQSTRQFAANLLEKFDIPIAFQDERLSTAAVERFLVDEADMSRQRRGAVGDKMAAAYNLQGALDALRDADSLAEASAADAVVTAGIGLSRADLSVQLNALAEAERLYLRAQRL